MATYCHWYCQTLPDRDTAGTVQVQKRDAELVQLRQALQSNIWQPVLKDRATGRVGLACENAARQRRVALETGFQ